MRQKRFIDVVACVLDQAHSLAHDRHADLVNFRLFLLEG
jgi:hypothetical protein